MTDRQQKGFNYYDKGKNTFKIKIAKRCVHEGVFVKKNMCVKVCVFLHHHVVN